MKYSIVVIIFFITMVACDKADPIIEEDIVGTWQLKEQLLDPGDGSGTFLPVESDKTITFLPDGTFTSNGRTCFMGTSIDEGSSGSYDPLNSIITPDGCTLIIDISYEIQGANLILYYQCIEACAQKYLKIQ